MREESFFVFQTRREKKKSVPKKANFQQIGHKITGKSPQKTERNGKSVPKKANFQQAGHKITGKSPQKTERNGKSVPKKANFQ